MVAMVMTTTMAMLIIALVLVLTMATVVCSVGTGAAHIVAIVTIAIGPVTIANVDD
jgi:hypothetical protein